jgi:hypothetical protein
VEVYTFVVERPLHDGPNGLPIDLAIGLEAGLIRILCPSWNRRGRTPGLDEIGSDRRIVTTLGKAPPQYPDPDDNENE